CQTLAWSSWPDFGIRFWDVPKANQRSLLGIAGESRASRAAFSLEGNLLGLGHDDCTVSVWATSSNKEIRRFPEFALDLAKRKNQPRMARGARWNTITFLSFSADGRFLAAADNWEALLVWDLTTGKEFRRITNRNFQSVALSADFKTAVV